MLSEQDITSLLHRHANGDREALDALIPLVYAELHRIAGAQIRREHREHTLQPTALINEAWMRLAKSNMPELEGRAHFLGIAAQAMRQILVDHARRRKAGKRDGGIRVDVADPTDPTPYWLVSSRHPEAVAAGLESLVGQTGS